jgi:hypothetical protein
VPAFSWWRRTRVHTPSPLEAFGESWALRMALLASLSLVGCSDKSYLPPGDGESQQMTERVTLLKSEAARMGFLEKTFNLKNSTKYRCTYTLVYKTCGCLDVRLMPEDKRARTSILGSC